MPREGGASNNHYTWRLLDRPPEFTIGPRFARARWRAMTQNKSVKQAVI
jgi:hypothetical protein